VSVAPPQRPPAWTLRRGHPDLCPGSNQPCPINQPYRRTTCPVCGKPCAADNAPSVPGGGRTADHYPATQLVGQLDLFTGQETRG
jgi:hypothetical protein